MSPYTGLIRGDHESSAIQQSDRHFRLRVTIPRLLVLNELWDSQECTS
jgi:hypothetical protein